MKVKELIKILEGHNPEMDVVTYDMLEDGAIEFEFIGAENIDEFQGRLLIAPTCLTGRPTLVERKSQ